MKTMDKFDTQIYECCTLFPNQVKPLVLPCEDLGGAFMEMRTLMIMDTLVGWRSMLHS